MFSCEKEKDAQVYALENELAVFATEKGSFFIVLDKPVLSVWEIGHRPQWMRFVKYRGMVSDDPAEIEFFMDAQYYTTGTHHDYVEINTLTAGKTRIDITLIVGQESVALVTPDSLQFSASENQKEIVIANAGTKILEWKIEPVADWLVFSSESGALNPGKSETVSVSVNRSYMEPGFLTEQQPILSNSSYPVVLELEVEIESGAIFNFSDEDIHFGFFDDEKILYLKNSGNESAGWDFQSTCGFVSLDTSSGFLEVGDSTQIIISLDRSNLLTQTYQCDLIIQNNNGRDGTFPVSIDSYAENVIFFEGNIIDGKYNRARDVLVFCTTGPNKLVKYNTITESFSELTLDEPPIALSIGQDGNYAVVGFQNSFAYFDLSSMQVIQHYPVSIRINDVLLAPNNWAYITNYFAYESNLGVDLETGQEALVVNGHSTGRQRILLHPSGYYALVSSRNSSPAYVFLYDISSGIPVFINSARTYGCGPVWLSDDWSKLFNNRGDVMFFSLDNELELTYAGRIHYQTPVISIKTFDYHSIAMKFFTVGTRSPTSTQSNMSVYESQYFQYLKNINLPMMPVPDSEGDVSLFESEGVYGFFNKDGSKYHFLLRVQIGYPPVSNWAFTSFDVD